ncbi:MAG: hypothetical protein HC794_04745 [Nitrospiraceae bacterium]|nr:hypothetical protein [Nitrospiraceae bacterium]
MRGGGSSFPVVQNNPPASLFIEQNGLATWKQAVTNLPVVINLLLNKTGLKVSDIDFVIFHQANHFLINYIMQKMKIPVEKTYMNVEEIGNTGSASIGIALSEAHDESPKDFLDGLIERSAELSALRHLFVETVGDLSRRGRSGLSNV